MLKVVIGLGNPDDKYLNTRHNTGFLIVDELARYKKVAWREETKFKCLIAQGKELILVKPLTGMNLSGQAVSKVLSFFKVPTDRLYVIHDDVDFPLFTYKTQFGRESAGHKGVDSIIGQLGDKSFWRVRVGIGRPEHNSYDVLDFVLSKYSAQELADLTKLSMEILSSVEQS